QAVIAGFTGSGGHFLGEPEIEWLIKAESAFKARGISIKDEYNRHFVIADSYFNHEQYEKALEEFKKNKDLVGIELAEWFISSKGIKNGIVKIKDYPGRIPWKSSEITKAEDKNYLFVAYFKGPIYRYDKRKKTHAIIYAPDDKYDWCDALAFDGENLVIKLRNAAGTFIFNNNRQDISQLVGVFDVDRSQITVFFGPDFYEFPAESWVDKLRLFSAEKKKLLVSVKHREEDAIICKAVVMNADGTGKEEVNAEIAAEFNKPALPELPNSIKRRLEEFLERKFNPHYGMLGGTAIYEIVSWAYSPDKSKIAFLVEGNDGHAVFYPSLFVANNRGENITKIDAPSDEICRDIIWLSDDEIAYAKDARLWKATIK
ncbi:MAG: hypothetical protein Q8L26_08570, partial [Candidatus Omnitrophota bacterium]|nr:hypothetical protein [Candidatus Omnitrophota bacterium]